MYKEVINEFATERDYKEFQKKITNKIIDDLVRTGKINRQNMSKEKMLKIAVDFLDRAEIEFVLDYKQMLLEQARKFYNNDEKDLAILIYATWFEHWINDVIISLARRKNLEKKECLDIIRQTSFRAKYTWLLKLFEFVEIEDKHLKKILKLAEMRNSFVHYKFKEELDEVEKEKELIIENIEATINYLIEIENKYIYYR